MANTLSFRFHCRRSAAVADRSALIGLSGTDGGVGQAHSTTIPFTMAHILIMRLNNAAADLPTLSP